MNKKHSLLHGRTTVGERGQIVIPHNIREALKIKPGDELVVMSRGEKIILMPAEQMENYYEMLMKQVENIRKIRNK